MKKDLSKFLSLNWWDMVKSIIMFFLVSLGDVAYQILDAYSKNRETELDWLDMVRVAAIATIMYIIKQWFSGPAKETSNNQNNPNE